VAGSCSRRAKSAVLSRLCIWRRGMSSQATGNRPRAVTTVCGRTRPAVRTSRSLDSLREHNSLLSGIAARKKREVPWESHVKGKNPAACEERSCRLTTWTFFPFFTHQCSFWYKLSHLLAADMPRSFSVQNHQLTSDRAPHSTALTSAFTARLHLLTSCSWPAD
jgi:hypothetical protein